MGGGVGECHSHFHCRYVRAPVSPSLLASSQCSKQRAVADMITIIPPLRPPTVLHNNIITDHAARTAHTGEGL